MFTIGDSKRLQKKEENFLFNKYQRGGRIRVKPNLVEEKDKKVKELQDKIAAVNFTPESKMGKMLMAKCRTLQEENEEIGNQDNEGKLTIRITTLHPNSNWLFPKSIDKLAGAGHKNGKWHVLHALCADY
ncbi:FKBP12-interacting protein of 37 kDa [Capsicum baccatum]|uniref:FKBP12-interacting protein of 37 kDa n=1 Tax=Capsicum baccatum TaxID=33114 RepID=A0A2G2V7J2_CAPBA|nr:FKBP12-interacting protein of 37 kDa [Capsicum baccatum]